MTRKIPKEEFQRLTRINDALNVLTELPLISDEWATEVFITALDDAGYSLDEWAARLECDPDPEELLLESIALYKEGIEGTHPFNAAEIVVGYLLEEGLSSTDAHSMLCTAQLLYDFRLTVVKAS